MREKITKLISLCSVLFILLFLTALLNRTGSLILLWKEEPLGSITHDSGHGYYAFVRDENISRLGLPFFLKEDEKVLPSAPLSVNEDRTASIKETGGGTYQIMENNDLYFSASDNRIEDHEYSIISPVIIRNRYLLIFFCLAAAALPAVFYPIFRDRNFKTLHALIRWGSALFLLFLFFPWDRMIFPAAPHPAGPFLLKPLLQRNAFFILLLAAFLLLHIKTQKHSRLLSCISIAAVLFNTVCYFAPEWNYYGVRADSPAYLQHYDASSIRTPGYPVFIETVYKLTGSGDLEKLREDDRTVVDEKLLDGTVSESHGLLNVARAQKIVLGAAFLILFAVCCRFYPPGWFAFAAQIILCGGFLGVDNSYIMTECLSQAVCLLTAALFLMTLKEKRGTAFLLMCVLSGIGMLIRPANLFLVIPIGMTFIWLLQAKRNMLIPLAGCLLFAAITAVPSVTIWKEYKTFVWMPTSGYVEIARATELLQPGDEDAFDDPELRDFTRALLEKKEAVGDADQNTYMWQVGIAAAQERGYDLITCSPLLGKVSRKVFMLHPKEFVQTLADTMQTALQRTRLRIGSLTYPCILLLFTVFFVIKISTDSLAGMILVLMHTVHLFIFIVNQPERRYIYSTEILCLLGWLIILVSLINEKKTDMMSCQ